MSWRRTAILTRWLGPWAKPHLAPERISRRAVAIPAEKPGDRELASWFYLPPGGKPRVAWLVTPGLHFNGPDDPRLDRLCRILASSGAAVLAPSLPDHRALRVTPRSPGDLERAFDALVAQPELPRATRPAVFAISFGSLPALRLAAGERCRDRVRELVLFGGYADFTETIRYALTGLVEGKQIGRPDPLNKPVVFMNALDGIPDAPADREPLMAAWHSFCVQTWGREEMKQGGWRDVAERLSASLSDTHRPLFRLGVGLDEGTQAAGEAALARLDTAFCDPSRGGLEGIRCPVHIVHGASDDVIPANQARKIAASLPAHVPVAVHLTGLYGHADRGSLPGPVALARELRTLYRVVRTLARAPG